MSDQPQAPAQPATAQPAPAPAQAPAKTKTNPWGQGSDACILSASIVSLLLIAQSTPPSGCSGAVKPAQGVDTQHWPSLDIPAQAV